MTRKSLQGLSWLITMLGLIVCLAYSAASVQGLSPSERNSSLDSRSDLRKIEPALLKAIDSDPDDSHSFLVHMLGEPKLPDARVLARMDRMTRRQVVVQSLQNVAEQSQAEIIPFLTAAQAVGSVETIQPFWVFNGLAVTGQGETALAIARRKDVQSVRSDHVRHLSDWVTAGDGPPRTVVASYPGNTEWNIQRIRADQAWNALDIDGSQVVVANMDSGVDWQHPALFGSYRGNVGKGIYDHRPNWFCATDEGYAEPTDGYGHGTHTMGTMVGRSDDHAVIGVAPGARWIAAKIFNDGGLAYDSWIHAGFQWMLDPGETGDPALMPDIVNNSWGSDFGYDLTFRADVQAWRAAGIVPIFSAGNAGPYYETVGSPGSFPESITAGATDSNDYIAHFSSRGPSYWGMKPDVSAPGVDVVSSVPGGEYVAASGTSMAAPHVAGVSALLLQANPLLSIDQMKDFLSSTAVRRGSPIPNNEYGWGQIDAYQAVATAGEPGYLSGTVRRSTDSAPIPNADILAQRFLPAQGFGQSISDGQGQYDIPLAPWTYDVTISAFGYYNSTVSNVAIITGTTSSRDLDLTPLPTGRLHGRVANLESGNPISATLVISGTPVTAMTISSTGYYSVDLPAGTYSVRAQSSGHRVAWGYEVPITTNETTEQNFALSQSPTILLVDSGAWYGSSQATFFQQALDDLNYLYDRRTIYAIYGSERSVPTAEELARYDVVIWSCPDDSPGYVGAWEALATYLDGGGKLFLSGQDIGYWDYPSGAFSSPEYGQYLQAIFVRDDSGSENLAGLEGELLQGLDLQLNGGDGANNQDSPDEITYMNEAAVNLLARYNSDGLCAQEVEKCSPYQTVYFSFGFEGISQRTKRQEVMERILDAFTSSPPPVSLRMTPARQGGIQSAGQSITYTLQVHNMNPNGSEDTYHLSLDGHDWPSTLSSNTITVAVCDVATVTAQIDIPADTPWATVDVLTISAQSSLSSTIDSTAIISTSTPAPVLLVDHDRWYDMEAFYQTALDQNNLPYDYWKTGWKAGEQRGSPPLATLQMYPMIIWFTGYDWASPLNGQDEQDLASALDTGSNLFLTSQDYLYVRDLTPFGQDYLGISSYSGEMTTTQVVGVRSSPVSNILPAYSLIYPYPNRSDAVTPIQEDDAAFEGNHELPVGLTQAGTGFRTSFFAFPFETISPEDGRRQVMRQTTGWLSWLGGSTFTADSTLVAAGTTVTYALTIGNDGWQSIAAAVSNTLPEMLTVVPGSLTPPEASYDSGTHRITWSKHLAVEEQAKMTYQATVSNTISTAAPITNVVQLGYSEHLVEFDRAWILDVNAPDLSASSLSASKSTVDPGEVLTYTIILRNDGLSAATSTVLTDPIPAYTSYVTSSLHHDGGGAASDTGGVIAWHGSLNMGERVTLTYQAEVATTQRGVLIHNVAYVQDNYNPLRQLTADTLVSTSDIWLPLIGKDAGG